MKKQIKNSILGFAVLFGVFSCAPEDWIDYSINNDPDAPSTVPMSLILPAVQQSVAYQLNGNNTVRTTALWMQQFDGVARQSFTETRYQLTPADVNNVFDDIYSEILINCKIIIDQAEGSSPHFSGVAKVLTALSLGVATDLFGDIPYSEALQGSDNLTPAYDSQESIYQTIFSLLDSAISDLSQSDNVFPLAGDLMYNGDVSKWIKAAYSLKARHYIQLSNKSASAYSDALAAAELGFFDIGDDLALTFDSDDKSPFYQFMDQRGDIVMGGKLYDILYDLPGIYWDPRIDFYFDDFFGAGGSVAGSENADASLPGAFLTAEDATVYLMSVAELYFIKAEADAALGNNAEASTNLQNGITRSMLKSGADFDDIRELYIQDAIFFAQDTSLENIITHKYIDGFGTNQPYADWRRTGFPQLDLAIGAVIPQIPTRFPYPQDELNYNAANVPSVSITDKVWWDE